MASYSELLAATRLEQVFAQMDAKASPKELAMAVLDATTEDGVQVKLQKGVAILTFDLLTDEVPKRPRESGPEPDLDAEGAPAL